MNTTRADLLKIRERITIAKDYADFASMVETWTGEEEFAQIVEAIEKRGSQRAPVQVLTQTSHDVAKDGEEADAATGPEDAQRNELKTPPGQPVDPASMLRAPLMPANSARVAIPAFVSQEDVPTPTPTPGIHAQVEKAGVLSVA